MARTVERRVTAAPERTKPPGLVDATRKGRCSWCMFGDCEHCAYWLNSFQCPCACPTTTIANTEAPLV